MPSLASSQKEEAFEGSPKGKQIGHHVGFRLGVGEEGSVFTGETVRIINKAWHIDMYKTNARGIAEMASRGLNQLSDIQRST